MNKRKTIVHLIDTIAMGGTENLLKNTLPLLSEYNNILVYLYHHPVEPEISESEFGNIPIYCLNTPRKTDYFRAVRKIRRIIKDHHVDILHSHLLWSTLIARKACPGRVQHFFTIHNMMSSDAFNVNKLSLLAERLTYSKSQIIIAVSKEVLEDYKKFINVTGKSHVLYNFVPDTFFQPEYKIRSTLQGNFRLVAVGTIRKQKNYFALVDAFAQLKDYPITLDIYGTGSLYSELTEYIQRLNVAVRPMGAKLDIDKILPEYDAYIMSSIFEGFGIAPMEAMAVGLPVILSDIPVFREVAGNSPIYFDPKNSKDIAEKILFAYNNWEMVKNKSEGNREHIEKFATKSAYKAKLLEIYDQIEMD